MNLRWRLNGAWLGVGGVALALFAAAAGACSSSDTMSGEAPSGAGASSSTTGTWTTATTGTWWGQGGGSVGAGGSNVEPPPAAGSGGAAGAPACASLDSSKPLVLYLSADDSNSMASPVHARELIHQTLEPRAFLHVRTYEFLNYYRIAYPAAPQSQLALFLAAEDTDPGSLDLQIAVRSFDAPVPRRPMTITLVLDTSGSMEGTSLEREKAVVKAIAKSLAAGDIMSVVKWNTTQSTVLAGHVATGSNDPAVLAAADGLAADGSTDLSAGLVRGYELANQYYGMTRLNRVVLVSDGGANTGVTDKELIALNSQDADKEGIYLVGVGTGPAPSYNDILMDTVTDRGRGAYVYIDSTAEAERIFVDRFDETMDIAARAAVVAADPDGTDAELQEILGLIDAYP